MNVGDTLYAISEAGLTLKADETEDTLKVYPAKNLTQTLATAIRQHKADIIKIVCEDEEMRRTGVIQCERQVFGLAREHLGPTQPFDPSEHPPSIKEMWTDPDKEKFFFPERYPNRGGAA